MRCKKYSEKKCETAETEYLVEKKQTWKQERLEIVGMILIFVILLGYFWEEPVFYIYDLYLSWMLLTETALFSREKTDALCCHLISWACCQNKEGTSRTQVEGSRCSARKFWY